METTQPDLEEKRLLLVTFLWLRRSRFTRGSVLAEPEENPSWCPAP